MATAQLDTVLRYIHKVAAGHGSLERTDGQLLDDFSARRDETAFAALVARHGSMVLRVCRRVLNHEQDAEDAFQATFLILARKSRSVRKPEALAEWLHGVAYRTALEVKRSAARRRDREARLWTLMRKAAVSPTWDDVQSVLDEEIRRLPEPLRAAFVRCVLEGESGRKAAAKLGVKEGTISSRLTRARQLLQQRLVRRGIKLSALLAALSVADSAAQAGVPALLAKVTIRSGLLVAAGGSAAGQIPSHIAALAAGVTRAMFLTKAKIAVTVLFAISVVTGAGVLSHQALAGKPVAPQTTEKKQSDQTSKPLGAAAKTAKPQVPATKDERPDAVTFSGRVLDPDGKPVKDAKLYVLISHLKKKPFPLRASTGADGTYRFTVPKGEFDRSYSPEPWKYTLVVASADGYGLGLSSPPPSPSGETWGPFAVDDATIRLGKDMPIIGRVLDLQAKPIAGVKVRVRGIQWPHKDDLSAFIAALKTRKEGFPVQQELLTGWRDPYHGWELDNIFPPVVTDADGRFRIKGIGRERLADLLIAGPTIETKMVYAMTRPCETIDVPYLRQLGRAPLFPPPIPQFTHYGANFEHVAPPSKPVIGVVRDKDTGKPIPGAVIKSYRLAKNRFDERVNFRVVADKDGRYRITGLPYAEGNQIQAGGPPEGKPYMIAIKEVGTSPALEPITVDIELKHGVWISGKVTDKATGKPVRCMFEYFPFEDNLQLKEAPGLTTGSQDERITEDGTFRVAGLPGHGVIAVRAFDDRYLHGVGKEQIKGAEVRSPFFFSADNYHALAKVNPEKDAEEVTCNLVLDPGKTLTGTILGPDGKPLAGAFVHRLTSSRSWNYPALATGEFAVTAVKPGEPRRLQVVHKEKGLASTLLLRGDEKGPLTIKLEPWGVVTGKLVTPEGKNPTDYQIMTLNGTVIDLDVGDLLQPVKPDKDGKFRIEGLVPGLKYHLQVGRGNYVAVIFGLETTEVTVKSGETKDIGELRVKSIDE